MRTRLATGLVALAISTLALTGCSDVQDTVESAAGGLATQGAAKASGAAASVAKQQLCSRATDGDISAADLVGLAGAVTAAQSAGVSTDITGPAQAIVNSGGNPDPADVAKVQAACAQ